MIQRDAGWSSKDGKSKSKTYWQSSAVEDAGQSSKDQLKSSKCMGKWKEISNNVEELGMVVTARGKWREISLEIDALGSAYKRRNLPGTKAARKVPKESPSYLRCLKKCCPQRYDRGQRKEHDKENSKTISQRRRSGRGQCPAEGTRPKQKPLILSVVCTVKSRNTCTRETRKLTGRST